LSKQKKSIIEYRNYDLDIKFPVLLLAGDRWHISDIKSGRLHFHNCLEIGICHSDGGIMELNGKPTNFKAGDITCIPRNLLHTTYSHQGTASLWSYVFFDPEELFHDYTRNQEIPVSALQNFPLMILNKDDNPRIFFLVNSIIEELKHKKSNYQTSAKSLLLALCIDILRVQGSNDLKGISAAPIENVLVISPALDYIHYNYMHHFSVDVLADLCHLSMTHFRRVFHSIMGTSPLEYLNKFRINKACSLLRSTEHTILSISEQVGFCSVSSFNRNFTNTMSMSASSWKKQLLQSESGKEWKNQSILEYDGWV